MSESLSRRVGRLVSGGFHALMDSVEQAMPEAMMEESIREIDAAIDEVRLELGRVLAQKHLAGKKLVEETNRHEALKASIQEALKAKRDDLAEAGVGEQLDIEARLPVIEQSISQAATQEKELEGFVLALQAKKRDMRHQLQLWRDSQQRLTSGAAGGATDLGRIEVSASKSAAAFDRVWSRQSGLALDGGQAAQLAKLKELEDLRRRNRIQERLSALRDKDALE